MNKLFTKVATLSIGLALAIGVGVAVGSASKEASPVQAAGTTVKYTVSTKTSVTTSGTAPTGSSATFSSTANTANQLTYGKQMDLTLTGFDGLKITGLTLSMKSNSSKGKGSMSFKSGSNTICSVSDVAFNNSAWNGAWSTSFVTISWPSTNHDLTETTVGTGESLTFNITNHGSSNSTNSLYCEWIQITYEAAASDYVGSLSVSPSTWTGYDSQTLSVSSFTVSGSKNGTAGAVTSSDYEYKGIGYMSSGNFVARDATFSSGNPTTADTRLAWKAKYPTTSGGSTYAWAYVTLTVSADSVNSIAISGSMTKTTYNQGDAWDPAGFTVKAYYASAPSTPVDVTSNANLSWTYSPATTASTSTTSVTCTASFGGKSATSSAQTVTVNEKSYIGGIVNGGQYVVVSKNSLAELPANETISSEYKSVAAYASGDNNSLENCWTFTTTGTDNVWTLTNYKGETLKALANNDSIRTSTTGTNSDEWTASLANDTVTVGSISYTAIYLQAGSNSGNRYLTYYSGNTSFRGYTSTTSQGADSAKIALIPYETPDVLDGDLTLTGKPASLTAGSTFPGVTKAEAEYSNSGTIDVTSNVTYTLGGTAIAVEDTIPANKVGASVEVVVTYTDAKSNSATASFNVPVVNKPVTSVSLNLNSATIAKGGTVSLTATVSDEFAIQTVKWTTSNSSIATLSSATSTSGNAITVTGSSSNSGTATITAYVDEDDSGTLNGSEKYATCSVTVSADPVLNMLDDEENVISGETFNKFTTDSNIYLHVSATGFVGEITYTWSSSNTSAIAIKEEADEMCEFSIKGVGTNVRLSCHAVGATSGNLTTYIDVNVAEPQVDEVTWSAPASLSVYDNASLTAANITSWSPTYHKDNGDSGSITSGYTVKLGGSTITLSHNWDVEEDGEELWIEYGGIASSHVTVQVTEHLNRIDYSSWSLVTDINDLSAGDVIILANAVKGKAVSSTAVKSGETLAATDVTIVDGVITSEVPSETARFTLGGNSTDGWSFKCGDNYLYFNTSTNSRTMDLKADSSSYDISIDGETGDAVIGDTMRVVYNASANPVRWSSYNTTTETASMLFPEIYKSSTSNIADTNVNAQRAILGFAKTFNSTMNCDDGGSTANVASKWSSASSAFATAMNALGADDKAAFKRLVANASAVEGGDSLQDMLARYDYIIAKYKLSDDFLHDGADRGAVQYAINNRLTSIVKGSSTAIIIIVASTIGLAAVGGYFFLRKKER